MSTKIGSQQKQSPKDNTGGVNPNLPEVNLCIEMQPFLVGVLIAAAAIRKLPHTISTLASQRFEPGRPTLHRAPAHRTPSEDSSRRRCGHARRLHLDTLELGLYKILFHFSRLCTSQASFHFRPACIGHSVEILVHDYWAIYAPPPQPPFVFYTP